MLFCVLNDIRFPCPRSHMYHVRKLGEGFIQRGYHYRELSSVSEVASLSVCDVLYVSNHFSCDPLHRQIAGVLGRQLFRSLEKCQAKLILWNFHTVPEWAWLRALSPAAVHLGEDLYPAAIAAEPVLQQFRNEFNVVPLRYASPMHPQFARFEDLPKRWDMNFVGSAYKQTLTEHCNAQYRAFIRNTPPAISEPLRVNSFRQSEVNLVFHSNGNVTKGVIVERFAEALSFGGIIFHDHPRIKHDFTSVQSLIEVSTTEDIDREFARIMSLAPGDRTNLRRQSYEAWKASGRSYFDQAGRILAAFQ